MKARMFLFKVFGVSSTFAARLLDLALKLDSQIPNAHLVHWLDQTQRLIENAPLMFRPIRTTRDAAEFASIKRSARRTDGFNDVAINGEHHRGNARELKCARYERT